MLTQRDVASYSEVRFRRGVDDWAVWATALFAALILSGLTILSFHVGFPIAAALYLLGAVGILVHARLGLYLMTFFAIVGEPDTISWYPFNKNGSSHESILFVHDKLVVSPYEGYVAVTFVAMIWYLARNREPLTIRGEFTYPTVAFSAAAVLGVMWGFANGSVLSIAINQSRNIIIIPLLYLLAINLITERRHMRILLWLVVIAIAIEAGLTLDYFYRQLTAAERLEIRDLGVSPSTHASSLHANISIFLLFASGLIGRTYRGMRWALPLLLIPTGWAYILSERRSAVGALLVAFALLALVLFRQRLQRFLLVVPITSLLLLGYTAAFWNAEGTAGFPAQAIRSQISPVEGGQDRSSDLYRIVENLNLEATIHSNPLLGTGFGRPFQIVVPLPDISDGFPLWNYLPHNSVLFIWINAGLLGMFTMLYLWFKATRIGTELAVRSRRADDILVATVSTATIVMIAMFTYLDISWDNQSVLLMTLSMGMITTLGRIQAAEAPPPEPTSADPVRERADLGR